MSERIAGLDLGTETIKVAEIIREGDRLSPGRTWLREHHKDPARTLRRLLSEIGWAELSAAAVTGRMAELVRLEPIPFGVAVAAGLRFLHPELGGATVVSIGSRGFSVTDLRSDHAPRTRESARCSQGTGNFLRQLVERFDLDLTQADVLCDTADAAPLSGRCPVILKTDLTHLANKGVERSRILAGLYDAVCENVVSLIRPEAGAEHLVLLGGVARSARIRRKFRAIAEGLGQTPFDGDVETDRFLEAFGAARVAAAKGLQVPAADALLAHIEQNGFTMLTASRDSLSRVHRMSGWVLSDHGDERDVILGLDIGSTGSKGLAIDATTREPLWEHYTNTLGDPVGAAQRIVSALVRERGSALRVRGVGVTGSGREITGSLFASCYGVEVVFVLNEIAAHAEGALSFDREVDTIFEIGGQDAKYIRLDGGRVCDAAMNEACSAGTGSFIEEQGRKFDGVDDVVQMGEVAMQAEAAVSLGQHCSVFMAEIIDQAVGAGVPNPEIVAGIYDSVVQNYLNRVKGSRSVGNRIFCQGMPFMSDALAAAVARRTGRQVVVPPNPGTIGALGIALLGHKELNGALDGALDLSRFLAAEVEAKEQFVCGSTKGCGGAGNACRIDRLRVNVAGMRKKFVWGGSCSLYDRGAHKKKLPDRSPHPFRERETLVDAVLEDIARRPGQPRIALTDEFALKGLFPFFTTFLAELGFDVEPLRGSTHQDLKRGIQLANVPLCAPAQIYHGVVERMLASEPDHVLLPLIKDLPRQGTEPHSCTCPMLQGAPGMVVQAMLRGRPAPKVLDPVIEMGAGDLASTAFRRSCEELAARLGVKRGFARAFAKAVAVQRDFGAGCRAIGARALAFAREHDVPAVVVLGRGYTIHNDVLNSNVPSLLRDLGALPVPVDCYPTGANVPSFDTMYWHYGQVNLRAAHEIRRSDGVYGVYCSNYACGPDSFNLHFFAYSMENKPFALIETDGHSGDAGTRTRIEAFLYCVEGDRRLTAAARQALARRTFTHLEAGRLDLVAARDRCDTLLIPRMGEAPEAVAAVLRSEGFEAEVVAPSDRDSLALGRRQTSGKECLPMVLTAGALLRRLEQEPDPERTFAFLMPTTCGPCRMGTYNVLHQLILERTGNAGRVRIVSPPYDDYFAGLPGDLALRIFVGIAAMDLLCDGLLDVRPVEKVAGAARAVYDHRRKDLLALLEHSAGRSPLAALAEARGGVFGVLDLLRAAGTEFAAVKDTARRVPTVALVGEIYVRLDPFANDFAVERLEALGLRARLAPTGEFIEYAQWGRDRRILQRRAGAGDKPLGACLSSAVQHRVAERLHAAIGGPLGWHPRTAIAEAVAAARVYVDDAMETETLLTVGGPLFEFGHRRIDGVVSVGPFECMPNKISESHLLRAEGDFGLPSVTLALNGDPLDARALEAFVYQVKERAGRPAPTPALALPAARRTWKERMYRTSGSLLASTLGMLARPRTNGNGDDDRDRTGRMPTVTS